MHTLAAIRRLDIIILEIKTRLLVGAWQHAASLLDMVVENASNGSACNSMVVPHVQQVVALRVFIEPSMGNHGMRRLIEFGHVRIMVAYSCLPQRVCAEIFV